MEARAVDTFSSSLSASLALLVTEFKTNQVSVVLPTVVACPIIGSVRPVSVDLVMVSMCRMR